ncbi:hypothetical protein [Natronorubrum bangense]|uniref:Uncharacterized protein n=2 Tax=Natronorubrum bangense TaxID=61858 RepID=L9WCI4_9EURY|nr:hypothetical protein [Natronorubrum bangense]ELY46986.1 hypothetical protein C494_13856 [Natronorubrum bangense JCM 10635]QCC56429.1 hypothetical protein DV706_18045 [Natronorubrum bangense]
MNRTYIAVAGIALLGLILMLNPFYFYPDGGGDFEVTYHVEEIENESVAEVALLQSEQVLHCPGERPCALERQILETGSVEYDGFIDDYEEARDDPLTSEDPRLYPIVRIEGEMYLPESEYENNRTILTLSNISSMDAVEHASVDAEDRSKEVREAVETGSVTVYGERVEEFEQNLIIEHDEDYYWQTRYRSQGGHWTAGGNLSGVRVVLFTLGGGLLAYAGWCVRKVTN